MSEHCPQDGGFIGDGGCTHPKHEHSELVREIITSKKPRIISVDEADAALSEKFFIISNNEKVCFGDALKRHLDTDHIKDKNDVKGRKERLMFAVHAVRQPDKVETNHRGIEGRTVYAKRFEDFGVIVISDKENSIVEVFNIIPKRSLMNNKRFAAYQKDSNTQHRIYLTKIRSKAQEA